MHNLVLSPIDPAILAKDIAEKVAANVLQVIQNKEPTEPAPDDPLNDFISRTEVKKKFASESTLWRMEKEGLIMSYGFGGKRYYKRSELLEAFEPMKQKRAVYEK